MMRVVGLMSGTSADGIDVGIVDLDGAPPTIHAQLVKHITVDYDPVLQAEIFACFRPESSSADRLSRLHFALGEAYAAAVSSVIKQAGLTPDQIDLVGSHGQTIWYDAPESDSGSSLLTLGEPAIIAERTGITTISNFRSRDLAAGGHGAPLVSYLDWLLFRHPDHARAIQNIGGIGNVTGLPPLSDSTSQPLAFDTGPGNMIIDYCTQQATNGAQRYDEDGKIGARGHVYDGLLADLMAHPYINQAPPKTTGRELFGVQFGESVWNRGQTLRLTPNDIVATATAFTAQSIAAACQKWIPWPVKELYIAGGGSLNPTLLAMIAKYLPGVEVHRHDDLGIPATAKECVLFALLAYETWHNRPGSLPAFTGAAHPVILGNITPGRSYGM